MPPPPSIDVQADIKGGKYASDKTQPLIKTMGFFKKKAAFIQFHGTRPALAGLRVESNPVGLLAWIGEKMMTWFDETPAIDLIPMWPDSGFQDVTQLLYFIIS